MVAVRIALGLVAALGLAGCSMLKPADNVSKSYLVFFRFDSADLTVPGRQIVDEAAAAAKTLKPSTIAIAGYADDPGSKTYNLHLSERRIAAVMAALQADGLDPKLFLRIPLGDSEKELDPVADRRVEIRLQTGKL